MKSLVKYTILFLLFYTPIFNGSKGMGSFTLTGVIVLGVGLSYWWWLGKNNLSWRIKTPLDLFLQVFLLWMIVSVGHSIYLYPTVMEVVRLIVYLVVFYGVVIVYKWDRKNFSNFTEDCLNIVVFMSTVEAIWFILYYYKLGSILNFPNANLLAGYLVLGSSVILSYLLFVPRIDINKKKIYLLCLIPITITLSIIHSRGSFLGLGAVIFILTILKYKQRGLVGLVFFILLIMALFPQRLVEDVLKIGDPYGFRRLYIWKTALEAIAVHPYLGWGLGNFGLVYPRYNFPNYETVSHFGKITRFTHNEHLQLAAEAGIPALILFWIIIFLILRCGWRLLQIKRKSPARRPNGWIDFACFMGLIGIGVHSLVDFNLHLPALVFPTIIFSGIIMAPYSTYRTNEYRKTKIISRLYSLMIVFIIGVIVSFYLAHLFSLRGDNLSKNQPLPQGVKWYRRSLFLNPWNSYNYEKIARIYTQEFLKQKNYYFAELAVINYEKAITTNPEEARFYNDLGLFYYYVGTPLEKIETTYQEAFKRNPYHALLVAELGTIYFQKGYFSKAQEAFQKAIYLEPNYLKSYFYLALTLEKEKKLRQAEETYKRLEGINNSNLKPLCQTDFERDLLEINLVEVYDRWGMLLLKQGKIAEALPRYEKIVKMDPNNAAMHSNLAGIYFALGNYQKSRRETELAIKLDPDNPVFEKNLELLEER